MINPKHYLNFLVVAFTLTVTTVSEAGFGGDGISCMTQNQWVEPTWDLWNGNASGFKTWVRSKSTFLRDDKMAVRFMLFDKQIKYSSGKAVVGIWGTKSPYTNYCLGGCGPNCDALIRVESKKSKKNRLMQIASMDCLEHDMCMIFHGSNKIDADMHCSDEWMDSVDNHVANTMNGNSPVTPNYNNIDYYEYIHCAVMWNYD